MHRFRKTDDQTLIGRDVFVVALFAERPFPEAKLDAMKAFEHWLAVVPRNQLEWVLVGGNASSYKAFTPAAIERCRRELDSANAATSKLAFFQVRGGEDKNNPSFDFTFSGSVPGAKTPNKTSLVEVRWPSDYPQSIGEDAFVEWVRALAALVPYRSGYASPALSRGWENMAHIKEAGRNIVPLAFRHPGYDLPENEETASFMGKVQCRGAYWLTMLGREIVDHLGGQAALAARLSSDVKVYEVGTGLMLRAGPVPELGDVNRAEFVPLLRSVAAAIEPVTHFEDWRSLGQLFEDDKEKVLRWERRHVD